MPTAQLLAFQYLLFAMPLEGLQQSMPQLRCKKLSNQQVLICVNQGIFCSLQPRLQHWWAL